MDILNRSDVNAMIREQQGAGSIRALARKWGVSAPYLSDVLLGRREIGPKILVPLGLKKTRTVGIIYSFNGKRKKRLP